MKRVLGLVAVAALAVQSGAPARAGAETAMDKYRSLLQEQRALQRENAMLKREADIAATKLPYLVFDVGAGKLDFRVRGKTLKSYAFSAVTYDERGRRPADPQAVWKALEAPMTVVEWEGSHPELIPPDPETGREAGLLYSDPNQLQAQTGATPVHTDAGVLGVDAPTHYYIKLDSDVTLHVQNPQTLTFREKAADRLSDIAAAIKSTWSGWWGGKEPVEKNRPRVTLYLTTDPDTAKCLHFSLLPGEKVFVEPPHPLPIVLAAAR